MLSKRKRAWHVKMRRKREKNKSKQSVLNENMHAFWFTSKSIKCDRM